MQLFVIFNFIGLFENLQIFKDENQNFLKLWVKAVGDLLGPIFRATIAIKFLDKLEIMLNSLSHL